MDDDTDGGERMEERERGRNKKLGVLGLSRLMYDKSFGRLREEGEEIADLLFYFNWLN